MSAIWINGRFLSQPITGVQRYAREITRALIDLGQEVRIIVPQNADISEFGEYTVAVGKQAGHLWEQLELPAALKKRGAPRLLNLANTGPVRYRNQFATLHDVAYLRFPDSFSWRFRMLYKWLVPAILKRSRAVITVSEFSKREIIAEYGQLFTRIEVVPNAVNAFFLKKTIRQEPDSKYFLAVSSITKQKNFNRLVSAYLASAKGSGVCLSVVGAPHRSFASVYDGHERADGIEFLGRVSDDKLVELYGNALAFVFPSVYEGFGMPPLEAQACGCPVLAARIGAVQEVLGGSALYFDPYDVADMRAALERILHNVDLRQSLSDLGLANVRRFNWQCSAEKIQKIYFDETFN